MSLSEILFSFNGRVPRSTFWYFYLASMAVGVVLMIPIVVVASIAGSSASSSDDMTAIMLGMYCFIGIVSLLLMYPTLAVYIKRAHDLNHSGWFVLVTFIPLIGSLWLLIELGFLPGTPGPNQYGPDPTQKPIPGMSY